MLQTTTPTYSMIELPALHLSWPPTFGELSGIDIQSISSRTLSSVSKEMCEAGCKVIPLSIEAALHRAGYDTVGKLIHSSPSTVVQVKGVGPKRLLIIQDWRNSLVNYLLKHDEEINREA